MVVRFWMTIFFRCVTSIFINRGRKKAFSLEKTFFVGDYGFEPQTLCL